MTIAIPPAALRWITAATAVVVGVTGAVAQLGGGQAGGGYREQTGKDLYDHICQGCHMPDAKGAVGAGAYPALANDPRLAARLYPVVIMLRGQKAMPSFADLSDAQIAEVTNYIRRNFGNSFPGVVTADEVKALRPQAVQRDALRPG